MTEDKGWWIWLWIEITDQWLLISTIIYNNRATVAVIPVISNEFTALWIRLILSYYCGYSKNLFTPIYGMSLLTEKFKDMTIIVYVTYKYILLIYYWYTTW